MRQDQFFFVIVAALALCLVFQVWLPFAVVILGGIWFFTGYRPDEFQKHQARRFVTFLSLERVPARVAWGSNQVLQRLVRNRRDRLDSGDEGSLFRLREVRQLTLSA